MRKLNRILPVALGALALAGWMTFQHFQDKQKRPALEAEIQERRTRSCIYTITDKRDYGALLGQVLGKVSVSALEDIRAWDITVCPDPRFSLYHKYAHGGARSVIGVFYPDSRILTIDVFPVGDDEPSLAWPVRGGAMMLEQFHADFAEGVFKHEDDTDAKSGALFYAVRETRWPFRGMSKVTFLHGQENEDDFGRYPVLWEASYFVQ